MENTSDIVKDEFDEQLEIIKEIDKNESKYKTAILYSSFIIAFIVILTGTIITLYNYNKIKTRNDRVHNIIVDDY